MTAEVTDTPLDFALRYAQAGYRVIPVNGKIPRTEHGAHDSSTDEAVIRAWWTRWPDANIGMTLGGLVAVDVDPRNNGDIDTLPGELPETCYAATGGGGWHYLFRAHNGTKYPGTLGAGVDVKTGPGAYIVVEPSVHASGNRYNWLDESEPWATVPAEAPDWLAVKPNPKNDTENHAAGDLLRNIEQGNALHDSLRDLAARYIAYGLKFVETCSVLENAMHASKAPRDDRWQSRFNSIPALVNSAIEKFRTPASPIVIANRNPIDWSALGERNPPLRHWAVYGWLGYFVNLLVGSAGIGKTLLAQQMGSALALGRTYIDEITHPLTVLMWACEDDHDELWRRQVNISRSFGVELEAFAERLIILPRQGLENTLLTTEFGRPMWTSLIGELTEQANDYRADVIILDNAAQLYGASENDRHSVTMFMNGLAGALPGRAVLLLAHPARAAGSEFSGSGAWEAVARNRLFLGSRLPDQQPDPDEEPQDEVRYLCRRKANYSSKDYRRFTYRDGVLVPDAVEAAGGLDGHLRDQTVERAVLDGLKRLQGMGIRATEGSRSPLFLPRQLTEYKLSDGHGRAELSKAMRRLMIAGMLIRTEVGHYSNRTPMFGLTAGVHK